MRDLKSDPRFKNIEPFRNRLWLASPTMHGEELKYMTEAYETNWMSTVGKNIDETERLLSDYTGVGFAVGLSCGTAALHLAVRLAGERLYGRHCASQGTLTGHKVFCSDMTFAATVNPVAYEGGEAVFIDTEPDTWNMDPAALEQAFAKYPDVRLVILAHLYGIPARLDEIRDICRKHDALLIEDAAESLGAFYKDIPTGRFGDYGIVSFNGNKIITGSSGGALLTDSKADAEKVRKWSTQSRETAPWYEHEEPGYNYRMSNVIAGAVRGQFGHLDEHIKAKKKIYERYREGLKDLPVLMNPYDEKNSKPNFWLSCMTIDPSALCENLRSDTEKMYIHSKGKSCPDEILDALEAFNAEGRPIWKPMHLQPLYKNNDFVTAEGGQRGNGNTSADTGTDIFLRGLCLPSDIKMTEGEQDVVIEIVHRCFE